MGSYRPSQSTLYYGGDGFLVNLNPLVDSGYGMVGVGNVARRSILGQRGRTADGIDAGINPTVALRYGSDIDTIRSNTTGFVCLRRNDAGQVWIIPVILLGLTLVSPAAGVVTRVANFVQRGSEPETDPPAAIATETFRDQGGGSFTIPSGGALYVVKTSVQGSPALNVQRSNSTVVSVAASKGPGIYPLTAAANPGYTLAGSGSARGFAATGVPLEAERG